jgi:hypothetical protein
MCNAINRCAAILIVVAFSSFTVMADSTKQALFERVFGEAVQIDPDRIEQVKAKKPGEYLLIDRDGDGTHDEAWYLDPATRHTKKVQPILVRAIDEDGDLDAHMGPDLDSDLYVADWNADGTVDVVLDYQDNDGDNDVDEMAFYFWLPSHRYFGRDSLGVWWGRDDGDDNLLWYDVNYTYYQHLCQYRCHFSGDESFVAFGLKTDSTEWMSAWENPFLFYDTDADRCSEVVLRIEGQGNKVKAIRYSFDVDDDAFGRRTHDYDFSITAIAEENQSVILPADGVTSTKLRGIPTQAWLHRDKAQPFVHEAQWYRAVLTWDEINANTDRNVERDPNERWEGIIAHPSANFPQIGGPPCSPLNKRNEVSLKPIAPMRLYYDPSDRRLHLKGANEGWLHVDFDLDGKIDAKYTYIDENQDGLFDRRQLDLDADGKIDFDWPMKPQAAREFPLEWRQLRDFYKPELHQVLDKSQAFIDAVKQCFAVWSGKEPVDPAETFFRTEVSSWMPATKLGEYIRKTPAGARLYVGLVSDRMLARLKEDERFSNRLDDIERIYASGDYGRAAKLVTQTITAKGPERASIPERSPSHVRPYRQRIPIIIDNTDGPKRVDWPVAIPLDDLPEPPKVSFALVAPERRLDWRIIPFQAYRDDALSFLADVEKGSKTTYYLYYDSKSPPHVKHEQKTGTAEDWVPPNIGWESNRCAYRAYWGQFDFFGKKTDQLIYADIGTTSYHQETDWGIDALHVGKTSGLGGLTLYVGGKAYLVQNPAGKGEVKFAKRILTHGPIRAVIEMTAENVVPDQPELKVRMLCLIYAERQETEIRVTVTGAKGDVRLAPGLVKLPRERFFADQDNGSFGSWGWQESAIGEIGMGLIVSPRVVEKVIDLKDERRILCKVPDGKLRYWVIGDWRRGRQHPIAPTIDNWHWELNELAKRLLTDVRVTIGQPEKNQ